MLRVEVYDRALRASQNVETAEVWWARDAPYGWAGRGRCHANCLERGTFVYQPIYYYYFENQYYRGSSGPTVRKGRVLHTSVSRVRHAHGGGFAGSEV
jgi:hypothetical protein